jgi:hypothetical protein
VLTNLPVADNHQRLSICHFYKNIDSLIAMETEKFSALPGMAFCLLGVGCLIKIAHLINHCLTQLKRRNYDNAYEKKWQ